MKRIFVFVMLAVFATLVVGGTVQAQKHARSFPKSVNIKEERVSVQRTHLPEKAGLLPRSVFSIINVPGDFPTIQAAINAGTTMNGDTINVAAGTFIENITVTKSLTIRGAGQLSTFIQPAITAPNPGGGGSLPPGASNIILIEADNITIHDLTLDGNNPGISSGMIRGGVDIDARNGIITNHTLSIVFTNLEVHHVTAKNIYLRGIYASTGGTFNFHDNTLQNVQGEAASIALFNFGGSGVFENNTVSSANDAIASNWSTGTKYLNNNVTTSGSGIHTDNAGGYGGTADTIQGNTVANSILNGYGIWVFAPYNVPLVDGNIVTNVDVGLASAGQSAAVTPLFSDNTVNGMGKPNSTGVYVTTSLFGWGSANVSTDFSGNHIINNTDGIYFESEATYTLTANVSENTIAGNTNSGAIKMTIAAGSYVLNMTSNWWGSATGPFNATTNPSGTGNSVADNIDYDPWWGADFVSAAHPWTWYTNASNGSTIQDAIDEASSGDVVNVTAGAYEEQLEINKSLTLQGASAATTTITSPATLTKFFVTPGPNNNYPVVYVHDASGVAINQFTVDGAGRGNANYRFIGVGYRNAGGTISNCTVKDIRNNPIDGGQHGVGLYALADDGNARVLNVSGDSVFGFQKNGTVFAGANLNVNVTGNTVTGAGPVGFIAQNGIQLSLGATGSINANNISGLSYTGGYWASSGLLMYAAGGTPMIWNNTLTNCQIGINAQDNSATIRDNIVSASTAGTGLADFYNVELYRSSAAMAKAYSGSRKLREASPLDISPMQASIQSTTAPIISYAFKNNTLSGDGVNGYNMYVLAIAPNGITMTADSNTVRDAYVGIVTDKDPGATLTSVWRKNKIFGNDYGMVDFTSVLQDARENWWGHITGPADVKTLPGVPNYNNPTGQGDTVTSYVDYRPWLVLSAISASAGVHGAIAPSGNVDVVYDANQTFTMLPDFGYHVDSVFADGVYAGATANYTFFNVTAYHTISVKFAINIYTITASSGPNGVINPSGAVNVVHGSNQLFTMIPNMGYHVDTVKVDGSAIGAPADYTFTNITTGHTIDVMFAINTYVLNVAVIGNGSVTKNPDQSSYVHGTSVELTAVPDRGWKFDGWSGDITSTSNPLDVAMTSVRNLTATFVTDPAYLMTYRTAKYEEWAMAIDQKGKKKSIKKIPDKVDFKFLLVAPAASTNLNVSFSSNVVSLLMTRGTGKTDTMVYVPPPGFGKVLVINPNAALGDTFQIEGWGEKGKPIKARYTWVTAGNPIEGNVMSFLLNRPRLPMPNLHNVGEELYKQSAFPSGLAVGIVPVDKSTFSVLLKKYWDVQQSMVKNAILHTGTLKCFARAKNKPHARTIPVCPPDKYPNPLFAEVLTLKLNVAASAYNKFPNGLGELTYLDETNPNDPLNGLTVNQIVDKANQTLACMNTLTLDEAYAITHKINLAFSGVIDTLTFGTKTALAGVLPLIDVPYFRVTPGAEPLNIASPPVDVTVVPETYSLYQNYPNPFNPTTSIQFNLLTPSVVTLRVFNALGQEVASVIDRQEMEDGMQEVEFDAQHLASGVYFYQLTAEPLRGVDVGTQSQGFISVKKMMLVK